MYLRLKKTKSSPVLQLVQAYRDQENRPRQKILLSLGNAQLPKEIWGDVAEEVENRLKGIMTFFKPSEEVVKWVEKIIKELSKKGIAVEQGKGQDKAITVNPADISHYNTTELGPLLPIMKAWECLDFPFILSNLGFNPTQIRDAALSIMNRLSDPCSENKLPDWIKTTSFEDLFNTALRHRKKDSFYRISDLLYKNKEKIEAALRMREVSFLYGSQQHFVEHRLHEKIDPKKTNKLLAPSFCFQLSALISF